MTLPLNESEFEKELRALVPAPASAQLESRIGAELQPPVPVHPATIVHSTARRNGQVILTSVSGDENAGLESWLDRLLRGCGWAFGGALATIAVLFFVNSSRIGVDRGEKTGVAAGAPISSFAPARSTSELIDEEPGEVIIGEEGRPLREYRLTYLERHTWSDPATGAVIEFELPREDVVLMPIAMQ